MDLDTQRRVFSENLQRIMNERGWNDQSLGAAMDCKDAQIWQYRNGKHVPKTDRLYQLARVLRCSPGDLLDRPGTSGGSDMPRKATMTARKNFSINLAAYMAENDETRQDVADIAGRAAGAVSEWLGCRKVIAADALKKLADHYGTTPEALEAKPVTREAAAERANGEHPPGTPPLKPEAKPRGAWARKAASDVQFDINFESNTARVKFDAELPLPEAMALVQRLQELRSEEAK